MFGALNKSMVRGWFEVDGRTLRPRPQVAITALKKGDKAANIMRLGMKCLWEGHQDVEAKFIDLMLQLRDTNVGLNSLLISFQMKGFLLSRIPKVCAERGGRFKAFQSFVRSWAKERLGWSFQKLMSNTNKLPPNWKCKGEFLLFWISCLVIGFGISSSLVVNTN